jgi:hypothetical protein
LILLAIPSLIIGWMYVDTMLFGSFFKGVLSVAPWAARPKFIEGVDRPQPLLHLINGGEDAFKLLPARR